MNKKVIIIGESVDAKKVLEVLTDNNIEAEIYDGYPKDMRSSIEELELKYEAPTAVTGIFHPKAKHSPKGHERKYKYHK